jgi:Arc/MetJ family transcription regulator
MFELSTVGFERRPAIPVQLSRKIHLWMCILWCMRTNIEIDDRVLHEAQELIGARTKREAVDVALRELVARHRRIGVLDLRGRVRWQGDLDESRRGRS